MSRPFKIIGLFCRISSLLWASFAKETYNFKEPTNRSHLILVSCIVYYGVHSVVVLWFASYGFIFYGLYSMICTTPVPHCILWCALLLCRIYFYGLHYFCAAESSHCGWRAPRTYFWGEGERIRRVLSIIVLLLTRIT